MGETGIELVDKGTLDELLSVLVFQDLLLSFFSL